jgi:hypothetical protein
MLYFHYHNSLSRDIHIDIGSNGTMAYHTNIIGLNIKDLPVPSMTDVFLSFKAGKSSVSITASERKLLWLLEQFQLSIKHIVFYSRYRYVPTATTALREYFELLTDRDW